MCAVLRREDCGNLSRPLWKARACAVAEEGAAEWGRSAPQSAQKTGTFHEESMRVRLEACRQRGQADTPAEGTGVSEQACGQGSPPRLRTPQHSPGHGAWRGVHGRRGRRQDGMARAGVWDT